MPDTYQINTADKPIAAVGKVATDLADVIKGYREMNDRADQDLRPTVERLLTLHETHAAELFETLEQNGGRPEDAGSMMGLVHQAVAAGRDWFGALDGSAEPLLINGERRLIDSYNTAIGDTSESDEIHAMLVHQRDALQARVDALDS